jgi:hypothetical protein
MMLLLRGVESLMGLGLSYVIYRTLFSHPIFFVQEIDEEQPDDDAIEEAFVTLVDSLALPDAAAEVCLF